MAVSKGFGGVLHGPGVESGQYELFENAALLHLSETFDDARFDVVWIGRERDASFLTQDRDVKTSEVDLHGTRLVDADKISTFIVDLLPPPAVEPSVQVPAAALGQRGQFMGWKKPLVLQEMQ